ncbi:MAG TPA: LLM class flavin-dependent oxidoreductase, partial [Candidatus Microbacterium pullistercoris]|nr:LLM class flavin-dependent oxidoreductase [Candidatus Microbacterium pullistercoris]
FAAENAEAIFVAAPSTDVLAKTVKRIRDGLEAAGRDRYDAKIYTLLTIVTGATEADAREKKAEYDQYASTEGALTFTSGWMGVDLSQYDWDEPLGNVESNAIQSALQHLKEEAELGREWTVGDLARRNAIGGLGPTIVGSGEQIADELQRWVSEADVDGFNLAYAVAHETWEDVIEHVIPVLRERGVYPDSYAPGTLRQKLQGAGDRVKDTHRAARYRVSERAVV